MHSAETIHVVPSFHYDVAYLRSCEDYLPRCFAILDEALRILDEDGDYRFTVEQVYLLERYWDARPQQHDALRRHARSGRLEFAPGAYVLADMNLPLGEALYQQMRIGRAWLRATLGVEPTVYYNPDDWGHPAQLPQVLWQCGYHSYLFWRCMRRDVLKADFVWEGMDGTRLPAHWFGRGYGNLAFPDSTERLNALEINFTESGPKQVAALLGELRLYGEGPDWLMMNGGDFRHPQASAPEAVRRLNTAAALPAVCLSSLAAFMEAQAAAARPVVDGEFNSALQGTFTANVRIKQADRRLTHRLLTLERLAVVLGMPLDADALWKPLLKQQFHDIICGTLCDEALQDSLHEFDEAAQAIEHAAESMQVLAAGRAAVVPAYFNPLPFARVERIEREGGVAILTMPPLACVAAGTANLLSAPSPVELPAAFTTADYAVCIGADGYITSLRTSAADPELVRQRPCPFGAVALQMDYGDLWLNFEGPLNGGSFASSLTQNHADPFNRQAADSVVFGTVVPRVTGVRAYRRGDDELVVEQEAVIDYWRVRVPISTRVVFSRHTPRIEYRTRIEPAGKHYRLRAAFPTTVVGGRIRHEVAFGVAERGEAEHAAQTWIDYAGLKGGVALLNAGTPASGVHEGTLMLTLFRAVAMEYKAASELSFAQGVPHVFDYAVVPHTADGEIAVLRAAHAFNLPPLPVGVPAKSCRAGSGWHVQAGNIVLSGMRWEGDLIFVRLHEALGWATETVLRVPANIQTWAAADGLQQPTGVFALCEDDQVPLIFRPFEIKNLMFARL